MSRRLLAVAVAAASLVAVAGPAGAITYGEPDGDRHPYVGLMRTYDEAGATLWRCSGTLISETVFLTAGHCTEPPAVHVEIWFDADVESGIPGNGYPMTGDVGGTPYTHPQYDPAAFFLYDLGIVVLDEPMPMPHYGKLPRLDQLDALKTRRGLKQTTFTAVGYGLQRINPVFVEQEKVRMLARPHLIQINTPGFTGDFSMLLSNNASTGGTCFGDSGGPNFLGDSRVIAGVTSFGISGTCGGTGGVYRIDRADDLEWIATFVD